MNILIQSIKKFINSITKEQINDLIEITDEAFKIFEEIDNEQEQNEGGESGNE